MGIQKNLTLSLIDAIAEGRFGASGSRFPSVRELAADYGVSYVTAQRACEKLRQEGLIRLFGGRAYLTTGRASASTPLAHLLEEARVGKRRFGLHMSRIDNIFFTSLAAQLTAVLEKQGWKLIIMSSGGDSDTERRILDEFQELGVSGIFTCPGKVNVGNLENLGSSIRICDSTTKNETEAANRVPTSNFMCESGWKA
ncbi:MAG: GntR family transcriptional regulator, partial [Ruminococcaceae bacterium]|nr:GntR family transcriptional regulator [Oscillospiraceae bacterium]